LDLLAISASREFHLKQPRTARLLSAAQWICWAVPLGGVLLMTFATLRPAAKPANSAGYVVIDANGVPVTISRDGRGTVLSAPMLGEYLLTTSDPKSLLSFNRFGVAPKSKAVLERIYPELRAKDTKLAAATNPEYLMLTNPSAVIPWGPATEALRATQLPVVDINTLRAPQWWFDNVRIYGDLDGQPTRGAAMKENFYSAINNLLREVVSADIHSSVTMLEASPNSEGTLRNSAVSGRQSEWLDLARGRNALQTDADGVRIDMERLYRLDPDVIVLSRVAALTPAEYMNHPLWWPLKAARTKRIYKRPPGMVFTTSGIVEYPIYARWLAELLHPDQLQPELRQIMRASYQREIHYTMTDRDLDELLAVDANRFSAHHERFEAPYGH
jgi:iron complex transport system substrate-binding protein